MEFSRKKLQQEGQMDLRICPVDSVEPYALMLAPVYVFMKANRKYVAVKAPLDFFSPEELERWRPFESFYFSEFVDASLRFREAGRRVKALLEWSLSKPHTGTLGPAPFEISDAVLRSLGPLWSRKLLVEPFFIAVFANEVCRLLPGSLVVKAREHDVARFELAVFRSSWAVFLALHLGYCDLAFLEGIRLRFFGASISGVSVRMPSAELQELAEFVEATLVDGASTGLGAEIFDRGGRVPSKIAARLERVKLKLVDPLIEPCTIRGPRGFLDG